MYISIAIFVIMTLIIIKDFYEYITDLDEALYYFLGLILGGLCFGIDLFFASIIVLGLLDNIIAVFLFIGLFLLMVVSAGNPGDDYSYQPASSFPSTLISRNATGKVIYLVSTTSNTHATYKDENGNFLTIINENGQYSNVDTREEYY